MSRRRRIIIGSAVGLVLGGAAAWHWQSELIGYGARWYLSRIAAKEESSGDLAKRRAAVAKVHRLLLLAPPDDRYVPELFDLLRAMSARVASGEIDYAWAAYVFTSYERDLVAERPSGAPRRPMPEVERAVEQYVEFYRLQKRPDVDGATLRALAGDDGGTSYTVDETDKAAREGRKLP